MGKNSVYATIFQCCTIQASLSGHYNTSHHLAVTCRSEWRNAHFWSYLYQKYAYTCTCRIFDQDWLYKCQSLQQHIKKIVSDTLDVVLRQSEAWCSRIYHPICEGACVKCVVAEKSIAESSSGNTVVASLTTACWRMYFQVKQTSSIKLETIICYYILLPHFFILSFRFNICNAFSKLKIQLE